PTSGRTSRGVSPRPPSLPESCPRKHVPSEISWSKPPCPLLPLSSLDRCPAGSCQDAGGGRHRNSNFPWEGGHGAGGLCISTDTQQGGGVHSPLCREAHAYPGVTARGRGLAAPHEKTALTGIWN
ncbi:unnamed protein product, partial [Gulo gulo]